MQSVPIENRNVQRILHDYLYTYNVKYDVTKTNERMGDIDVNGWYTSKDYLESIRGDHDGSPETAHSYALKHWHYFGDQKIDYTSDYAALDMQIRHELGLYKPALSQFYPAGGFIAWHNNHNASSYNLIFTWSETGDGYFEYIDPNTGDTIRMHDKKGWTCKAGYFGSSDEPDKIIWHCAKTNCKRITLSFTLGFNYDYWKDCVTQIMTP